VALLRKGRAKAITAKALEPGAVAKGHRARGVEAEALDVGLHTGRGLNFGHGVEKSLGGDGRNYRLCHRPGQSWVAVPIAHGQQSTPAL
jgi:hypothetical protein